jgi:protease-4
MANDEATTSVRGLRRRLLFWRIIATVLVLGSSAVLSRDHWCRPKEEKELIARIRIEGTISNGKFSSDKLRSLAKPEVKGIIVHIDSPGGDANESEKLYSLLRSLARKKPLVSVIGGLGVSGSYLVAIASDYLLVRNSSLVGAISTVWKSSEAAVVQPGKTSISSNSIYRSSYPRGIVDFMEKENEDANLAIAQLVGDVYQYFLGIFMERRKTRALETQEIANGQLYTGRQALEIGLVDELGDEESALAYLEAMGVNVKAAHLEDWDILDKSSDHYCSHHNPEHIDCALVKLLKNWGLGTVSSDEPRIMAIYEG